MRQGWRLIPAESDAEKYQRDCEENLILIQIEAESLRTAIRHEFALAKKVIVEKGEKRIVRTEFGWESVRETSINAINERELRGIAYYESEIRKLYDPKQQPQTAAGAVSAAD